ncbi:MAG: hypothetical protein LBG74_05275 [Spirochaetaceae bacterium]|nr:hypothetical protein [Spirochaetaceae bacterium]
MKCLRAVEAAFFVFAFCSIYASAAYAEKNAPGSADDLYQQGNLARQNQYWDKVVELWSQGEREFPNDPRFSEALGDVYANRELYRLAKEEYQKAEYIKPNDIHLLYKLAETAGSLNEDEQAARYLERLVQIDSEQMAGITLLGWMYFKLHRLEEGEALISQAIERLGPSPALLMMLGTLNSDMMRYAESSRAYAEAVNLSLRSGDVDFAAVANYNYSILESRFYRFEDARMRAQEALDLAGRASGHLALGELLLRRLDWGNGIAEYQIAFDMDRSPLSKLSLADTYRLCGRLEEARAYAEDCLNRSNHAWMLNYGIDIKQYKRDIHEILYMVYSGLYYTQKFTPAENPLEHFQSLWKQIKYIIKSSTHKKLFYKYALASGNEFIRPKSDDSSQPLKPLDALVQYYKAFGAYPSRAYSYLTLARETETAKAPASAATHLYYEGELTGNKRLLSSALMEFDPLWEKDMIARTFTMLCRLSRKNFEYAEQLYIVHPGALRQNGIRLPAHIEVTGKGAQTLRRLFKKSGFNALLPDARFTLRVTLNDDFAYYELFDTSRGFALVRDSVLLEGKLRTNKAALARAVTDGVFAVR